MRTVFLDTVGLVAIWDTSDQWHAAAQTAMKQLLLDRCRLVTTTSVFLECGNTAARTPYRVDVATLRDELAAYSNLIVPTEGDERLAWQSYARGEAAQAGIVDHFSFAVMRRLDITEAFTNDQHFNAGCFNTLF